MTETKRVFSEMPEKMPEADFECEKHGSYRGCAVKMSFLGNETILNPVCRKCEEEAAAEKAILEEAAQERAKIRRLKAMNIGIIYWSESFETFEAYTPELQKHLETARRFAQDPSGKLVMLGNNGTGKNHLAASILHETGGVIYTAFEIGLRLRQSYSGDSREWEVLGELCETPLLVIDEIGRSKGSDFDMNWLSHVINKRHENLLPLILISNRHLKNDCPENGCEKCLENFFDNDVISRIIEDGEIMKFLGNDYRYKKRAERRA